jgi:tetratricopeptide (TPR) repeat protein
MIAEAPPPVAPPTAPHFAPALRRFHRRWILGLFAAGSLVAIWWTGLALLLLGALDFYAGFSDPARHVVRGALATVAAAGMIWALWRAITFMRRDAAAAADRALASGRREALSALELQSAAGAGGTRLAGWLRQRAINRAAEQVRALRLGHSMPIREIARAAKLCLILVTVFALCALLLPRASWTITRRLLQPDADVPPYTSLTFALGPQPAEVLYGGEILITAEIGGGAINAPVRCLTRDPATGRIEDSPAFQEQTTRFSGKLEKVAAPVEVAFAVGRARSAWVPVAVRMQPKIQDVVLTVEPPAYSGLPRREFTAGAQDLAALPGSRLTARVSSNRPLGGGTLRIGADAAAQEVAAESEDTHRVRFSWTARGAARVVLEVRDVLGTASEPLQIEQKLLPDERPEAVLRQPAGDVLATPDSELPLEAAANDDLGLTRVALVRQLRGYRERSLAQPVQSGNRRHEVTGMLNLAPFGVAPGQVIELTLEAGDTNPNLLGVSVSEPARIHIIAREQYAAMLRAQTTLEEFSERYIALNEAMNEARQALAALEKAAQSGNAAQTEEARRKALEAHQKAAQIFGRIAKDFPIFNLDESLAATSLDAMQRLFDNARQLEGLSGQSPDDLHDAIPELKERLGAVEKQMAGPMKLGERSIAAGKVFEQAGVFQEAIEAQRELVKDFNRILEQIRRGEMQAGQALRDLGKRQREVAENLRKMERDLGAALGELPEGFERMEEEGGLFLDALREFEIPSTMDEGARAADSADSKTAGERAGEALAKLEALLRKKNGFCAMCRGEGEQPFPWPEDLSQMLQQLMQALIPKFGRGSGDKPDAGTSGPGFGGLSDSGFSMRGKMPQLPIYGPSRQRFARNAGPQMGGGKSGAGAGRGEAGADVDTNQLATKSTRNTTTDAPTAEAVPEAYREAVKRYFSAEESKPQPEASPKQP